MTTEPTANELTALRMLAAGYSHKQIARRLGIGRTAVSNRLWRMRSRLGATNNTQAITIADRAGLLTAPEVTP
jgi:DNA-binding NarL/FixJ family response regulator